MKADQLTRRRFITSTSATAAATILSAPLFASSRAVVSTELALNGGKAVRTGDWLSWPVWNQEAEAPMMELLRSGNWYRGDGSKCREFERKYAELIGTKRKDMDDIIHAVQKIYENRSQML